MGNDDAKPLANWFSPWNNNRSRFFLIDNDFFLILFRGILDVPDCLPLCFNLGKE